MRWDLGVQGVAVLLVMSLGFGLLAQLIAGTAKTTTMTRWVGLIGAATFFVAGLFTSEVWFGWATEEDLQPNVDGLSVDETLLVGLLAGVAAVLVTGFVGRRRRHRHGPPPARHG